MSCAAVLLTLLIGADAAPAPAPSPPDVRPPLAFSSRAEPDRIRLGEPFSYQLVIRHPLSQRYDLRPPSNEGPFELLAQHRQRVDAKDSATTTFTLRLAVFELGQKKLPDLTFEVIEPDRSGRFVAPGLTVEAIGSLPASAEKGRPELRDIKPPEDVPVRSYRLLWALGLALALAALAYAAYRGLMRRRRRPPAPAPLAPLDIRILAALEALRKEGLPAQGRAREFYFRLSEIARAYLGERYGFEALECTSAELLEAVHKLKARALPTDELRRFVAEADLVKFAKAPAPAAQCDQALHFVEQLVRRTVAPATEAGADLKSVAGAGGESSHANELGLS